MRKNEFDSGPNACRSYFPVKKQNFGRRLSAPSDNEPRLGECRRDYMLGRLNRLRGFKPLTAKAAYISPKTCHPIGASGPARMRLELHELGGCGFKSRRPASRDAAVAQLDRALSSVFDKICRADLNARAKGREQILRWPARMRLKLHMLRVRIPAVMQMAANELAEQKTVSVRIVVPVTRGSRVLTT